MIDSQKNFKDTISSLEAQLKTNMSQTKKLSMVSTGLLIEKQVVLK